MKRTIIHEDPKGIPVRLGGITSSELVKGIDPGNLPPLFGMDITGRRDNPLIEVPISAGPKNDPVLTATGRQALEKPQYSPATHSTAGTRTGSAQACTPNSGHRYRPVAFRDLQ